MNLTPDQRRNKIIDILEQHDFVDFTYFGQYFNVSEMTIRRDIEYLERAGEVVRVYGGAKLRNDRGYEASIQERLKTNHKEKQVIAKQAAAQIFDGDVIALDGSTTALEVSKLIKDRKNLTVITNNISIAIELSTAVDIQTVLLGGFVRGSSLSLVGAMVEQSLGAFYIDKTFISSRALHYTEGLTDITVEEGEAKKAMVEKSNRVYVLVDHTKLDNLSFFHVIDREKIDVIITDQLVPFTQEQQQLIENFRTDGIEVMISSDD
ncbi:transcriptional regulator, DeoR family [Seinonella peptonophila]|uniref:Transcriptional regulator, DeoR family n=1 Tax=Seinonella peptonophila TaxID=112248 RepID=A0A1M4ZHS1_9BACL|nr:DeoR/GlpR family DNA-binding transcription regulator [Seinonella peptonophila]SHF17136.1 transcriptional regulator, DeoR family [Seinonella peptonophila]